MGERKAKKLAQSKQYAEPKPDSENDDGISERNEIRGSDTHGSALEGDPRGLSGGRDGVGVFQPDIGNNDDSASDTESKNVSGDSSSVDQAGSDSEELTLTGIARLENEYSIIDKPTQKRLFNIFDSIFVKNHPDIVSVDDVGFFRHVADKRYYEPMPIEAIRREVSELLCTLGCLDFRGTSQISAKVESLQAYRPIRMSREESENVLFGSMKNGTILNTLSGFVDFNTGLMVSDNQRLFVTSTLPVQYDDSRETTPVLLEELCPRWMQFVREVAHSNVPGETENKMMLLQEMAGYCFTPFTSFQVAFLLLGGGANGKSTFLDTIKEIIGDNDTSTLSLADLSSQFRLSGLYRKRMNIIEEIPNSYFESDNLEKIISGQEITADRKYMQPIRFRPTAKLVFAVNQFPRVNDQTHALYRRFKTIPFNVTFTEATKDYELPQKLWAERDGIFRWAMQGWQRLRLAGSFTHSLEVDQSNEDFK
jgi:P4 family phage/plasmid primase-like protien